jgi:hypothetical protein
VYFCAREAIVAASGKSTVEACTTGGLTKPKKILRVVAGMREARVDAELVVA